MVYRRVSKKMRTNQILFVGMQQSSNEWFLLNDCIDSDRLPSDFKGKNRYSRVQ